VRVARSRAVVAAGYRPAVVARVAGISRQALYRRRSRRPTAAGPGGIDPDDQVIVEVAKANPTDGTRMVAALASRELGRPVNRKRVQRVMRANRLLQPSRSGERRRRPGFFRVTCPDELWHADMTKVWTAQHGWVYLHAIIDCCTRELVGWSLELRCRDDEAIACVEAAVMDRGVQPGRLTLAPTMQPVHLPRLPPPPVGPRDHPPTGRLPRSRVPGLHRVLVRTVQETPGLAIGVGVAGPGEKGDHHIHRRLPASAPLRAGLPHAHRGRHDLAARPRHATNPSDLTRQRQRGPRQPP
jgi:Integrase core domain/HTH-like domain